MPVKIWHWHIRQKQVGLGFSHKGFLALDAVGPGLHDVNESY